MKLNNTSYQFERNSSKIIADHKITNHSSNKLATKSNIIISNYEGVPYGTAYR